MVKRPFETFGNSFSPIQAILSAISVAHFMVAKLDGEALEITSLSLLQDCIFVL